MTICKHSKWISPGGRIFQVMDIWATGGGQNYKPIAYELKADGEELKTVDREVMIKLIESKKLKQII